MSMEEAKCQNLSMIFGNPRGLHLSEDGFGCIIMAEHKKMIWFLFLNLFVGN